MMLRLPDGRAVVSGNAFDLVGAEPAPPEVSVVIPYFEAQAQLDLVLTALTLQTHPLTRLEVIVADDGSAAPPDLSAAQGVSATLVRQDRQGFRAAAARNLGASRSTGEVLCFLDGDTVPAPDYVATLVRLPSALPDALVVGHREHADFTGWTPDRLRGWLLGGDDPPARFDAPGWLADGYRDSRNLLDADDRSFRYVISAVLGLTAALFREIGGFDPSFTAYGGEDWELGHRAWNAGAVLAHVPEALAWHDGPDWAARGGDAAAKNAETLALAARIPQRQTRSSHVVSRRPEFVAAFDNSTIAEAATVMTVDSLLGLGDVAVYLTRSVAYLAEDPRVRLGIPRLEGCAGFIHIEAPCVFDATKLPAPEGRLTVVDAVGPLLELTSTRATRRVHRWAREFPERALMGDLFGEETRAADVVSARRLPTEPDLAGYFARA